MSKKSTESKLEQNPISVIEADDLDINELRERLERDRVTRAHQFQQYLERGMQTYRVQLVATPQISSEGKIVASVQIVPLN